MRRELAALCLAGCVSAEVPRITDAIDVWPPLMYAQPPGLKEIILKDTAQGNVVMKDGDTSIEVEASPLGSALLVGPLTVSANHRYDLFLDGVYFGTLRIGEDDGEAPRWLGDEAFSFSDEVLLLDRRLNRSCRLLGMPQDDLLNTPQDTLVDATTTAVRLFIQPTTDYALALSCRDATGRETPVWHLEFRSLPPQLLRLNEIVVDPQRDWNDSSADGDVGVPFDDIVDPAAKASSTDEWVEIVNEGVEPVDATHWVLAVHDRDTTRVALGDTQVFGDRVLEPGGLLVARLSPSGKNATSRAKISLIDPVGSIRDRVELGITAPDGASTSANNEAITRCGATWVKQEATPGRRQRC